VRSRSCHAEFIVEYRGVPASPERIRGRKAPYRAARAKTPLCGEDRDASRKYLYTKKRGARCLAYTVQGFSAGSSASARPTPRKKAGHARKVHRRTTGLQRSARGKNGEETPASAAARNTLDKTSQTSLQGPVRARATKERCRWFHVRVQGCIHGRASCAAGGARAPCPTQIAVRGPERPGIRRFESPRRACAAVEHLDSAHQPVRAASVLGRVSDAALFGT